MPTAFCGGRIELFFSPSADVTNDVTNFVSKFGFAGAWGREEKRREEKRKKMEEVETLFNSVDKQNLQIWTNEFWDKIRKAERGMERSEKKWLLDQLTLVLAHLMGSLKEKKIASDDRSLLLFWLSYGNVCYFFSFIFFSLFV